MKSFGTRKWPIRLLPEIKVDVVNVCKISFINRRKKKYICQGNLKADSYARIYDFMEFLLSAMTDFSLNGPSKK